MCIYIYIHIYIRVYVYIPPHTEGPLKGNISYIPTNNICEVYDFMIHKKRKRS